MRTSTASASIVLLLSAAISGCGSDPASAGTDASVDAHTPVDASPSDAAASDASSVDAAMGVDASVSPEVAACHTEAARARAICAEDPGRSCFFTEYERLCDEGQAAAITDSIECFTTPVCHIFADPGETPVGNCLRASYAAHTRAESTAAYEAFCTACPTHSACAMGGDGAIGVPFEHLSNARLSTLTPCFAATTDCDGAIACLVTDLPELVACFE